jgi:hypothetical protein
VTIMATETLEPNESDIAAHELEGRLLFGGGEPPVAPPPAGPFDEDDDEEPISIQLSGDYQDGVYTAWARIPGPDPDLPLAEMRLRFYEDINGIAVQALVQAFMANVDGIVEDIDAKRAQDDEL